MGVCIFVKLVLQGDFVVVSETSVSIPYVVVISPRQLMREA